MMLSALAQLRPATQAASLYEPTADYLKQWEQVLRQSPHAFLPALVGAAAVLGAGLLLTFLFRRFLASWNLRISTMVLIITASLYTGLWMLAPEKMNDPDDYISLWLHRIFGAGFLIISLRLLDRLVLRPALTRGGRVPLNRFLHQVVLFIIVLYAFLLYLSTAFGFSFDRVLAGSAVLTIVVGLALQDSLGNLFAGLVLQASNPFNFGDWVEIGPEEGRVVDMTWRAVTILNGSGNYVLIPNSVITKQRIINHHLPTPVSGYSVTIGIDPGVPPQRVITVLEEALRESRGVLVSPAPGANINAFQDSVIQYTAYFSVTDPSDHWGVESRVRLNIWYRLAAAGIRIPYPTRNVEMLDSKLELQTRLQSEFAERLAALNRAELLNAMSDEQRRKLAQESRTLLLAPGQILFRTGDPGSTLFVIAHGEVEAVIPHDGIDETIVTIAAPQTFGEMTAMVGRPRPVTVRAKTECTLVEITKAHLEDIFKSDHTMMEKVVAALDARRVAGEARLEAAIKSHPHPDSPAAGDDPTLFDRVRNFFSGAD